MSRWVTCTDCNRVLLAEHGPTCPECLVRRVNEGKPVLEVIGKPELIKLPHLKGAIRVVHSEEPAAE